MTLFVECPLYLVSLVAQFPVVSRCFRANLHAVIWCLSMFPEKAKWQNYQNYQNRIESVEMIENAI